jgi:mono/diheme cytochrome c family protein
MQAMSRVLKGLGMMLGVLVGLVVVPLGVVYAVTEMRANKRYTVTPVTLTIPTDAASIARGKHLVEAVSDCVGCHGENLAGGPVLDDPALAVVYARNLTPGRGGLGGQLTDAEYVKAIRHGLRPDGRSLWVMPSYDYTNIADEDLAAIIAYLKTIPPVDNVVPEPTMGPLGRVLTALNQLPAFPAEYIDQAAALAVPPPPEPGVTLEYGRYLIKSAGCSGCHQPDYGGGPVPGSGPDDPPAANLTPAGNLGGWTAEDFIQTLRTGVRPNGAPLTGDMPWQAYGRMTDDELAAVFLYLQSLPPVER